MCRSEKKTRHESVTLDCSLKVLSAETLASHREERLITEN